MAIVWVGASLVVCGWRGGPGYSGSRRWSCSSSGAVPRPLFVARPLSIVERGRPGWDGCSGDESRSCRARARPPRAASPAARKVSNGRCQRELVILRRVVVLRLCGSGCSA